MVVAIFANSFDYFIYVYDLNINQTYKYQCFHYNLITVFVNEYIIMLYILLEKKINQFFCL